MDWRAVDLNLLVVFQAILDHRGVTRAGDALGLSQPAMSASLARLREMLDDPLFVRSGTEMKPTPRATELALPVRHVLETIRADVLQRSAFDAGVTERVFTIITQDIGEVNFLPGLLGILARQAPKAGLRTITLPPVAAAAALESGEAELALGYFPDLRRAGFFQQMVAEVPYVCLVRKDHPTLGERMTLKEYLAAAHAVVRPDGRARDLDELLTPRQMPRRVTVVVSHFMSLLPVLESSDLVATVPRDFADRCVRYANLRMLDMPFKAPLIEVHQFWHQRFHKDPGNGWLRRVIHAMSGDVRARTA